GRSRTRRPHGRWFSSSYSVKQAVNFGVLAALMTRDRVRNLLFVHQFRNVCCFPKLLARLFTGLEPKLLGQHDICDRHARWLNAKRPDDGALGVDLLDVTVTAVINAIALFLPVATRDLDVEALFLVEVFDLLRAQT